MAELLTTKEILVALDNIIKKAEKYICIFTYNIKIDPNYLTRLKNASKRGVQITIVFGIDNGDNEVLKELLSLSNCTVYFKQYLHAKFYYNEKELLVGSMNLSEASAKNNFELAVLFKDEEYQKTVKKVKEEAKEIIEDATIWNELKKKDNFSKEPKKKPTSIFESIFNPQQNGVCIRCKSKINYDPDRPLCTSCYYEWSEWENEDYPEKYCHCCSGKIAGISFQKPQCFTCCLKNII